FNNNLVSENGVFQFGFLERDAGELVVGIRYNLGPKSANLPVWTVGGGVRVSIDSTFRLSMDGRLIFNTSNLGVQEATLLNNGSLVLMGSENRLIWESFNRPTKALLPGQFLRYPLNLRAPSTKSLTSYYTFVVHQSEGVALMWESNITYWRTHLSSLSATVKEGVLGLYDDDRNKIVWLISSKDFGDDSHVRIDHDGNLRIYSWDDARVGWQAVEDQCNVFGSCGLYSVCGYNSTGPICDCLYSDSYDWGNGFHSPDSGSSGCKKMVDLGNCKGHTSMMVMKQTDLYEGGGVERLVRIGLWCTQNLLRPSVGEVMKVLEGTLSVDRPPSSFAYRNDDDTEKKVADAASVESHLDEQEY
ncbi:Bulb-type lectin domain-containing protein, partial [Cynara cardunculus var. scolymus]